MVEFINKFLGNRMLVAEERVEEYKAAGHKLAAPVSSKPTEDKAEEKPVETVKPVKAKTKKK